MKIKSEGHTEQILLRVPEAASALSLGRSTIYELIEKGEIPIVRIGRAVRIPAVALQDWVDKQAVTLS